jgi:CheY-like chemotaxis protein
MLQKMGHQTDQAENGKLALEMVRQRHFREVTDTQYDMIFLDNQMPVMTGVECARELRSFGCPIFICGATGNALQDDQTEVSLKLKPARPKITNLHVHISVSQYLDAGADRSEFARYGSANSQALTDPNNLS